LFFARTDKRAVFMLLKGIEEEVYAGTPDGVVIGLSHRVAADMQGYDREPDCRNIEFTTQPLRSYEQLGCELLERRLRLRAYLDKIGGYTLIPGCCLLQDDGVFRRSDPKNPYHSLIEKLYGTTVVTAGTHINIGLNDPKANLRACRLLRLEAPLFLALSANSPFHNGRATGYHSYRWHIFPKTPAHVPLFANHRDYKRWIEAQLASGTMHNIRHLWGSVRPNGVGAPDRLERVELRVCDRVDNMYQLMAITALLEARVHQVIADPKLDPLQQASWLPAASRADELLALEAVNAESAARSSLNATLRHWRDGREISAADWVRELIDGCRPVARKKGFAEQLASLDDILIQGNPAQRWLARHAAGDSIEQIMRDAIAESAQTELDYQNCAC
jgi:predicted glutamate--cysteine ligase